MDQKTRELRRRMKGERTKRGELSPIAPRWKGRKNGFTQRETAPQCDYRVGGKYAPIRRERKKDKTTYLVMLVVGGQRCPKTAELKNSKGHRCVEHASADYDGGRKKEPKPIEGSPRSGM